jgi:hypothetical protein
MADHRDGCDCKVCKAREAAQAQRKAAAELAQTRRDIAWMQVHQAGGPDAAGIMGRHRSEAPHVAQRSSSGDPWGGSPDHDERVIRGLLRGVPDAELAKIRAEVAAEYAGKSLERQARQQSAVLWRTRSGELILDGMAPVLGASFGENGAPVQQSAVHADVPELGSGT